MPVAKNIAYFLTAALISKCFGALQSFIVARALGPADFGVWVTLGLVVAYGPFLCLGTVETLLKQVPYYQGRKDFSRIKQVESSVMGSIVLSAILAVLLALITPIVISFTRCSIRPFLLVIVILTIATSYFSAFFYNRFAAYENFKIAGVMDSLRSILALICVGGLGWAWGLTGVVSGFFLQELAMCAIVALSNCRAHGVVRVSFRRDALIDVVRVGFPITLLWWVLTLQNSVDRVVLGSLLGASAVGHYGLGLSFAGLLAIVPMVVGRVLYPKMNKQLGKEVGSDAMRRFVISPTLALATLLVNMQVTLLIAMPFLYNQVLPKYLPGVVAGQILVLGSFFGCLMRNGANYLIAANQQSVFLKFICISLGFNIIADFSLVKAGWGIEGVAVGTSLAAMILTSLVWQRVLKALGFGWRQAWLLLMGLYMPVLLLIVMVALVHFLYPPTFRHFGVISLGMALLLTTAVNLVLCCIPIYRKEMLGWRKSAVKMGDAIICRVRIARNVC